MKNSFARLAVAAVIVLVAEAGSLANGRAPITNGIHFRPGDPQSLYLATTFGLLISHDDGCTFHWICEQNIGYGGSFDPKYAVTADGTIFATTFTGLRVSRDGGCSFTTATSELAANAPGRIADIWIDALDVGPTGEIWVATAESAKPNDVYRSLDNGVTFEARNMLSSTIWWKSVKAAPSDPQRVYVSGYEVAGGTGTPAAHLLRSSDAGAVWTESPLAGVLYGSTPVLHVVAVSPTDPGLVLVRSLGATPPMGDRLYRSTDGGATLTDVLSTADEIRDVIFVDANHVIVAAANGSYTSANAGAAFTALSGTPRLGCVGRRGDGLLFGCGANWQPDFKAIARSTDATSWDKVFRFVEMAGPLECPAGTAETDTCGPMWPVMQSQFATTGPACGAESHDTTPDAPVTATPTNPGCCDAGASPIGLVWSIAIGGLILRRRRGRS